MSLLTFLQLAGCAKNVKPHLTNIPYPRTIEEAADSFISSLSEEDKAGLQNTKKSDLFKYHFELGTGIRNRFG